VIVRSSDIDSPWLKSLAIFCELTAESSVAAQSVQQGSSSVFRRHMLDDKNGRSKIAGQLTDKSIESFQTSGRRTDNDDVMSFTCHKSCTPPLRIGNNG
jgi:hypothetical protein